MSRASENICFTCEYCGEQVLPLANGRYRNHCPCCLYSKHVDIVPGDRMSGCGGMMAPVGLRHKSGKGFQIVHRCVRCGIESANRVARDAVQSDDIELLVALATHGRDCSSR